MGKKRVLIEEVLRVVSLAIVTTNRRKSAEVIVAKKIGKPIRAKDQTVNQLE